MRYLPLSDGDREDMLRTIGAASIGALYRDIPQSVREKAQFDLPAHQGELEVARMLSSHAGRNHPAGAGPFFLGAGCYNHFVPAAVDYIIQRSEFMTAYTPYQPEIAQGTLQAMFEFQTFIAQLTGQEVANASLYDGATALAEAVLMAMRVTGRSKITIATPLHPHYREVLENYTSHNGEISKGGEVHDQTACVIVQSPDFFGTPHAYAKWRAMCDSTGALLIVVVTEILSLGLLPAPAEADIVCGEGQSIGLPMSFGGPHLGFFACNEKHLRQMPGRLCGETADADGRRGFVLTLNTREQHIRREKATSNICTNQGLCALAFTVHMALLGEDGFRWLARLNHEAACRLADAVAEIEGVEVINATFFNEFALRLPKRVNAQKLLDDLAEDGIIAGYPLDKNTLIMAATEMTSGEDIAEFCATMKGYIHEQG